MADSAAAGPEVTREGQLEGASYREGRAGGQAGVKKGCVRGEAWGRQWGGERVGGGGGTGGGKGGRRVGRLTWSPASSRRPSFPWGCQSSSRAAAGRGAGGLVREAEQLNLMPAFTCSVRRQRT